MNAADIMAALTLPPECRIEQRVAKKLLVEHGAPTPADKRKINEGIEELKWVAALKPGSVGVAEFRDQSREYLEIAVITALLRNSAKVQRIIELIHRAIPYPVVLITTHDGKVTLSLAHKRWSEGEEGKVVVENVRRTPPLDSGVGNEVTSRFLKSLAFARLSRKNLFVLYQGWLDRIAALNAAGIISKYEPPSSPERGAKVQEALDSYERIQREITGLRAQAAKEKQISRRADLNLEIRRLETEKVQLIDSLEGNDHK